MPAVRKRQHGCESPGWLSPETSVCWAGVLWAVSFTEGSSPFRAHLAESRARPSTGGAHMPTAEAGPPIPAEREKPGRGAAWACSSGGETLSLKSLARKRGGEGVSRQSWAEVCLGKPVTPAG